MDAKPKFMLVYLLISLFTVSMLSFGVKAQSSGAIVIKADGSVSGTNLIEHQGDVYNLTGDIQDQHITVYCSNIVFDGEGHSLQGAGGWGTPGVAGAENTAAIDLQSSNVTVENFSISGWEVGVSADYGGNSIVLNTITKTENAVAVYGANCTVIDNQLTDSIYGVYIKTSGTTVIANQISYNYGGIMIFLDTVRTTVKMNNFSDDGIVFTIADVDTPTYQIYLNNVQINANTTILETTSDQLGPPDTGSMPSFDNGSVGNYWSDYTAKYPGTTEVGNTSVRNTPYQIRQNPTVVDRYPLMAPVNITTAVEAQEPVSKAVQSTEPVPRSSNVVDTSIIPALVIAVVLSVLVVAFRNKLFWTKKNR